MNINRKSAEKIIGISLVIWSFIVLYYNIITFKYIIEITNLSWEEISLFKITKNYHFQFIIAILNLASGILLILSKRIGWMGSVVMSIVNGLGFIIFLWPLNTDESIHNEMTNSELLMFSSIIILFFIFGLVLLNKVFRKKYQPTKNTWVIITLIIIILCADKILIN